MKLTAGESFRLTLKRTNLKQENIVKKLEINKRSVSNAFSNFDKNQGSIKTLVEYANSIGFDVEFSFTMKKEPK